MEIHEIWNLGCEEVVQFKVTEDSCIKVSNIRLHSVTTEVAERTKTTLKPKGIVLFRGKRLKIINEGHDNELGSGTTQSA